MASKVLGLSTGVGTPGVVGLGPYLLLQGLAHDRNQSYLS